MQLVEPIAEPGLVPAASDSADDEPDIGAELTDDELGELLIKEITIDGMCGVY
jgi:mycofactocin precursor